MENNESVVGSSRGSAEGRPSDETLVAQPTNQAGPLPKKQGEFGWTPPETTTSTLEQATDEADLPARHPADRAPTPSPEAPAAAAPNASSTSLNSQSQSSVFKQFLRKPRPLPKINGIRSSTVLRVFLLVSTLIASIIGWVITVIRMNVWNASSTSAPPLPVDPSPSGQGNSTTPVSMPSQQQVSQMTDSSLVFVHVAFGAAVLFQLLMLERAVYRLRAERYAFLHPDEMLAASTGGGSGGVMSFAPWNRPPLPTYAAALGVRGTGDVEDAIIAAPPPPEYGNTRGSTLLLSAHLNRSSSSSSSQRHPNSNSRPPSQGTVRDALGRPRDDWSRPVSYGEDELRQDVRRSLDLEAALSQLEGQGMSERGGGRVNLARPENAVIRA